MVQELYHIYNRFFSVALCLLLSISYVVSLHVWKSPNNRDHPSTIKQRFISVLCMVFIAPCFLYVGMSNQILEKMTILQLLGIRTQGFLWASTLPLLLTMVLFIGPLTMKCYSGLLKCYIQPSYWIANFQNLRWLRDHIVGPFSEEFVYRSCMLPLLLQNFTPGAAVIICPLFFGVAHFHHIREWLKNGMDYINAIQLACFYMTYTTLFGMYAAFIFYRTGHLMSAFLVHAFCNDMGFPDLRQIGTYQGKEKITIISSFIIGAVMWGYLLNPLTDPSIYSNNMVIIQIK